MLKLFSKVAGTTGKTCSLSIMSASVHPALIAQSLYSTPAFSFSNSRQKVIVRYPDELKPFTINNLWNNDGSRRTPKRLGRGYGSTKGKTAARGNKGQRARAGGKMHPGFEGGQIPLKERLPKFGNSRRNTQRPVYINLSRIIYLVKHGRVNAEKTVTIKDLVDAGAFARVKYGVKVLASGGEKLDFPLNLEVSDASEEAIAIIKKNGGSVTCVYRTKLKMKEHIKPFKFTFPLEEPMPAAKSVKKMENIKERGAEVVYKVPEWKRVENEATNKAEKELKEDKFEYPAPRHEGVGKNKVRARKPPLQKVIDLGIKP